MLSLTFRNNRANPETFVIQVSQALSKASTDFTRAIEHGIEKVELKSDALNLSSQTDEITYQDKEIYHERQKFTATEFSIKPTQLSLDKITAPLTMELIVNNDETLGFIEVTVE
mgnify:CR=1 FL=1